MSKDVYNDPEHFGLEIVGELTLAEEFYSFDKGVVWFRPETKRFYYAHDSGCSCPSPFENYDSIEDLGQPMTLPELKGYLRAVKAYDDSVPPVAVQAEPILVRAAQLLDGKPVEADA